MIALFSPVATDKQEVQIYHKLHKQIYHSPISNLLHSIVSAVIALRDLNCLFLDIYRATKPWLQNDTWTTAPFKISPLFPSY